MANENDKIKQFIDVDGSFQQSIKLNDKLSNCNGD